MIPAVRCAAAVVLIPCLATPLLAEKVERGDWNFDGYQDVRIWVMADGRRQLYDWFLFLPETGGWREMPEGRALWATRFDADKKRVVDGTSGGHSGCLHIGRVFEWQGERLIEVQRARQDFELESGQYIRTDWRTEDGERTEVRRETVDLQGGECDLPFGWSALDDGVTSRLIGRYSNVLVDPREGTCRGLEVILWQAVDGESFGELREYEGGCSAPAIGFDGTAGEQDELSFELGPGSGGPRTRFSGHFEADAMWGHLHGGAPPPERRRLIGTYGEIDPAGTWLPGSESAVRLDPIPLRPLVDPKPQELCDSTLRPRQGSLQIGAPPASRRIFFEKPTDLTDDWLAERLGCWQANEFQHLLLRLEGPTFGHFSETGPCGLGTDAWLAWVAFTGTDEILGQRVVQLQRCVGGRDEVFVKRDSSGRVSARILDLAESRCVEIEWSPTKPELRVEQRLPFDERACLEAE
jgi:hypothetical protein